MTAPEPEELLEKSLLLLEEAEKKLAKSGGNESAIARVTANVLAAQVYATLYAALK
ncbi:membrane protein [Mycobacterium phage Reindeer]|uniref:Membrane protein n=1 Tax=Mycobacterium phage Reindeer TaxID=2762283 RepID=A0A7G8LHY8_9CAUD|nr:membrane protein [Mycobacterium phage Reindeer]QNJ56860.1 membrane protein [Mycobacterium phage Reindeer]